MNRSPSGLSLTWPLLIALILLESTALAQIEAPEIYPGVWYRIAFDSEGHRTLGDGDGYNGQWYHYPNSNRYRMWFYNDAYDPDREGYLNFEAYIMPVDPSETSSVQIFFNWSTPEWSALGRSGPPLPGDVPTLSEESQYMASYGMHNTGNVFNFESIEPIRSYTISGYNPEWISIDFIGRNARIYRGAWHECREKTSPGNGGVGPGINVCCRWSTGDCYTIFGGNCAESYETLDPGQTCDDCIKGGAPSLDFGDAPDPDYPTRLASNGARHTVVGNVLLGKTITAEADALTNKSATADSDDGVTFASALQPGWPASVAVTASTQGYLNAWIDFNGDGDFADAGEQVFFDTLLGAGANELTFEVPEDASPGTTFARFRFNSRGLISYDGPASDGEVEDYAIEISRFYEPYQTSGVTSLKWNQPPSAIDVANPYLFDAVTTVSTLDLHQIAADDFQLEAGRPITGIHWWGSFNGWTESSLPPVLPLAFHIGIWTDVPDAQPNSASSLAHPGTLVWEGYCIQWAWALAGYQDATKDATLGETCFQFSYLLSQDEWFQPAAETDAKDAEPALYWISISALYDPADSLTTHPWGWITRTHEFGEAATLIREITPGPWPPAEGAEWLSGLPVTDGSGVPWDLAFQLTTYGGLETTEPTKGSTSGAKTAVDLHHLALSADRWLGEMP